VTCERDVALPKQSPLPGGPGRPALPVGPPRPWRLRPIRTPRGWPAGPCPLLLALLVAGGCGKEEGAPKPPSAPPTIAEVSVVPAKAYASSILTAQVRTTDPEGRRVEIQYQWLRNGAEIGGATGPALRAPDLRRGSEIAVQVTPVAAGGVRGPAVTSAPITILNSAPSIVGVTVTPGGPRRGDTLTASVEARDPDDDKLVYTYQWLRSGSEIPGATGPTLPARDLRKGNRIVVRATASDGEITTAPAESSPATILNTPPRVLAAPSGRSAPDGQLTYRIAAEDPDGDALTYTLSPNAPKGMAIHPTDGTIVWRPGATESGTHRFTVTISDGDGGVVQQEIIVTVGGRP